LADEPYGEGGVLPHGLIESPTGMGEAADPHEAVPFPAHGVIDLVGVGLDRALELFELSLAIS
jgi:hypothetical protein